MNAHRAEELVIIRDMTGEFVPKSGVLPLYTLANFSSKSLVLVKPFW
jgi:hypothetical protein